MKQAKTLTAKEFKRALAVAKAGRHAERNALALCLSYYAGLRVKEIAALTVGDVYDTSGNVKEVVTLSASQTKGRKGRVVVVSKKLAMVLADYARAQRKLLAHVHRPLLRSQKGSAFSGNSLCQVFSKLYSQAAIDGASSHSGRRTFITNLAHKGVSAKVLMTLAGHQHMSTTQRYIDVNDAMLKAAVELV
ncbi:tyrosine-type recombinase/integrase [Nitrincola sp.]|uniref:tyrosine-type recombinase/integrase n=1 Tax=Nitrincola sp. TaxID=1926584 RepID=UPI003A907613